MRVQIAQVVGILREHLLQPRVQGNPPPLQPVSAAAEHELLGEAHATGLALQALPETAKVAVAVLDQRGLATGWEEDLYVEERLTVAPRGGALKDSSAHKRCLDGSRESSFISDRRVLR